VAGGESQDSRRLKDRSYNDSTGFDTLGRTKLKKIKFGDKAPKQKY
jgi:hypothetical protein